MLKQQTPQLYVYQARSVTQGRAIVQFVQLVTTAKMKQQYRLHVQLALLVNKAHLRVSLVLLDTIVKKERLHLLCAQEDFTVQQVQVNAHRVKLAVIVLSNQLLRQTAQLAHFH